jgi:hypothetical protein
MGPAFSPDRIETRSIGRIAALRPCAAPISAETGWKTADEFEITRS